MANDKTPKSNAEAFDRLRQSEQKKEQFNAVKMQNRRYVGKKETFGLFVRQKNCHHVYEKGG